MKLTPIKEYAWTDDYSFMREMTCKNHPTAKYLTKNPFSRGIHIIKLPEGDIPRGETGECQCPLSDLVVVEDDINEEN